jgi:CRP/FNR family transcriptional regulator
MDPVNLDSSAFVADDELVQALRARAVPLDCSEDRVLFRQGDEPNGLYILHKGEATMRMDSPLGDELLCIRLAPGSLLGLPGVIGNKTYSMSASARSGSELSFVSHEAFSKFMLSETRLAMSLLRVLAAEVHTARIALANV